MFLASETGDAALAIISLFWILCAVVLAPVLARLLRGFIPDVVLLLGFGVLVGPYGLSLATTAGGVDLVSELGLGMLFLLAGFEISPRSLGGRQGAFAWGTWLVCFGLATGLAFWAGNQYGLTAAVAVGIALSSTALGTLLPILKQLGIGESALGRAVLVHGAVGEIAPVVAMALLLSSNRPIASLVLLLIFALAVLIIWKVPGRLFRNQPAFARFFRDAADGTAQIGVRATLLMLMALMAIAVAFNLDVVLGAFAAGAVLRQFTRAGDHGLEHKLEAIGYGFLIPVFFVVSGMAINVGAVVSQPVAWILAIVAIWLLRGVPVYLSERLFNTGSGLQGLQRRELALFAATGLPIIVAVTNIAVDADLMPASLQSVLVAAGATTVLLFPLLARLVGIRNARLTGGIAA